MIRIIRTKPPRLDPRGRRTNFYRPRVYNCLMNKKITIIGAGIVGIMAAYFIRKLLPDTNVTIIDAGGDPRIEADLYSTTFGQGRDARQVTISESLSYQNPVHTKALTLGANEDPNNPGWRLIDEDKLNESEKKWRKEAIDRYKKIGHTNINEYDLAHTKLNHAGLTLWKFLKKKDKKLEDFCISQDFVYVLFQNKDNFSADLASESSFDPTISEFNVSTFTKNFGLESIYPKGLRVAGSAWKIKSLGKYLLNELEKDEKVKIVWHQIVKSISDIPLSNSYIWAVGTTHALPDIYKENCAIQGIAGCWITIPNEGFKKPFKISLPQPSGYINCTPIGNEIYISGGFGWTGELSFYEAMQKMDPIKNHLLEQISFIFKIPLKDLQTDKKYQVGICVRPSTPTGLPAVKSVTIKGKQHIFLSGSGKSGSTQAPLLGLYSATSVANTPLLQEKFFTAFNSKKKTIVKTGLEQFSL
jgi:hypothetical protein